MPGWGDLGPLGDGGEEGMGKSFKGQVSGEGR